MMGGGREVGAWVGGREAAEGYGSAWVKGRDSFS